MIYVQEKNRFNNRESTYGNILPFPSFTSPFTLSSPLPFFTFTSHLPSFLSSPSPPSLSFFLLPPPLLFFPSFLFCSLPSLRHPPFPSTPSFSFSFLSSPSLSFPSLLASLPSLSFFLVPLSPLPSLR